MHKLLETLDLDFEYAHDPSDAARRRIRDDLTLIVTHVARSDPDAVALILTGAFSRGEGSVHGDLPMNDYDLICVRSKPGGDAIHERLRDELSEKVGIHVDMSPVWDARLPYVGKKLFWLDVRLSGRVIAGDARQLPRVRAFDARELPREEIARLLGNRAAGLLLALPADGEAPDGSQRDLQATKAVLAAMDSHLLDRGLYAALLRERLAMTSDHPDHALFATAVECKLTGAPAPAGWWDDAAAALLRAVESTRSRGVRDGPMAHAVYAARARRVRMDPSRAVREAAWDLLADARWPHGPAGAARVMKRLGLGEPAWPRAKTSYFELRELTLQ